MLVWYAGVTQPKLHETDSTHMPRKQMQKHPGATQFRQAMTYLGNLMWEQGRAGQLDYSVSSRRVGDGMIITIYQPQGVTVFVVSGEELQRELYPPLPPSLRITE